MFSKVDEIKIHPMDYIERERAYVKKHTKSYSIPEGHDEPMYYETTGISSKEAWFNHSLNTIGKKKEYFSEIVKRWCRIKLKTKDITLMHIFNPEMMVVIKT